MAIKQSTAEQRLRIASKWFVTPFFAIGSGVITTVAVTSISFIAGLALPWLIPILAIVFLAESALSIYLFKDSVPNTLTSVFIHGIFNGLSPIKKILLSFGIFCALGGGFALGALTYTSTITTITAIFGLLSLTCPPLIGIVLTGSLGIAGFIAFSNLLINWISTAIKTDIHLQAIQSLKNLVTRDESKSLAQQVLENVFKVFFTASILLITVIGTIATLGTMQKGLIQFLSLIPRANMLAVKLSSGIIAYGLMGLGRLPWALQSVCTVFSFLGEKLGKAIYSGVHQVGVKLGIVSAPVDLNDSTLLSDAPEEKLSWKTACIAILKTTTVVVHALSFGVLAKSGGGKVLTDVMTDLHFPLSEAAIDVAAQSASMTTATLMQVGIGAFSLFAKPKADTTAEEHQGVTPKLTESTISMPSK